MIALLVVLLLAGCGDNLDQPARLYTCTVLYRCAGDVDVRARIGLPCATDEDDANEQASSLAIDAAEAETCPGAWQYVRPICKPYEPLTACDLAR